LRRELHRAHGGQLRKPDTDPRELRVKESEVELDVVGNDHPAAQEVKKHGRDLFESWCANDIAGSNAVDMRRADVTAWVDERRELAAWRHAAVELDYRDLYYPVDTRR